MKHPRIKSGHPDWVHAVTTAIPMMVTFTSTSFRAERNAAQLSEPPRLRRWREARRWCR